MPPAIQLSAQSLCPCGTTKNLGECCLPYITGAALAPTAETLMRSRYTAHVILAIDYLWNTWSAEQRVRSSKADIAAWATSCEWLGLQILATKAGQPQDAQGIVEFIALFRKEGELQQHHEISVFKKTQHAWLYVGHRDEQTTEDDLSDKNHDL